MRKVLREKTFMDEKFHGFDGLIMTLKVLP